MSNRAKRPHQAKGWAGRYFFCPLCGVRLGTGAYAFWCDEHGAFEITIEDNRPFVKKVDAA